MPGRAGGSVFLLKVPEGGGGVLPGRRGGRGREAVCGDLGGGQNIFFRRRNSHQDYWDVSNLPF